MTHEDLSQKFSPYFINRFKDNQVFYNLFRHMLYENLTPYEVIEYLCMMLKDDKDKLLSMAKNQPTSIIVSHETFNNLSEKRTPKQIHTRENVMPKLEEFATEERLFMLDFLAELPIGKLKEITGFNRTELDNNVKYRCTIETF